MIRAAVPDDVAAVLSLWEIARSAHAITPDDEIVVRRLLDRDPGALLVCQEESDLVGTLIVGWDGWRGNMYRLAVAPAYRRRGIATGLVAAGEERLRGLGALRVTALVGYDDDLARSLWLSVGYQSDGAIGRLVRNLS